MRTIKARFKIQCAHIKEYISLLPTIVYQPKRYAYDGECVIDITWLMFHLCIGEYETFIKPPAAEV